jgi:serine/threonine protein kinase
MLSVVVCVRVSSCGSPFLRDLKPENFLFDKPGPDAVLKVTDFGLGCQIASPDAVITEVRGRGLQRVCIGGMLSLGSAPGVSTPV